MHFQRIHRHNALVNYIHRINLAHGNTVHKEPTFTVHKKKLKPDLVIYNIGKIVLIDAQVVNDQYPLETSKS